MAINDVNNHPSKQKEFHFETLTGKEAISSYIDNVVVILEDLNPEVCDIVKRGGMLFLNKSRATLLGIKTDKCKVELHDALKNRSDDLINVIVRLIEQLGSDETVDICLVEYDSGKVEIINKYTNETIWSKDEFNPNFTKILLATIVEVLKETSDTETVREAFRCVLSFSTIYKDLRGSSSFILEQEKKAIERLSTTVYTTNEEFEYKASIAGTLENQFCEFMRRFIEKDNSDDPLFENLTRAFCNSLGRFKKKFAAEFKQYNQYRDANMSFKSSGTTVKHNGKVVTIPAIIASAFEKDLLSGRPKVQSFDELLGFEGEFGFLHRAGIKSKYRPSISIPQKKLAPRIIHIGENARQDRLGYYHNIISNFLRIYKCDCTFDQRKGVIFILNASGQVVHAVYCMDQSKATDTMLIAAQKLSLGILLHQIFEDEPEKVTALTDAWEDMVSGEENTFYLKDGTKTKYRMIVGQPQGYLSSFASFALLNHFIMLFSLYRFYKELGMVHVRAEDIYRLVGDDSAVKLTVPDDKGRFREIYIECNRMINVEVNPDKGYSNFGSQRTSTTAEFAKVLCINGRYFTPTPFNIASSSANTTPENYLKYLLWLKDKCNYTFTESRIMDKLNEKFTLSTKQLQGLDILLKTRTINNDFYYLCNSEDIPPIDTELSNRLTWFNFMNLLSKSVCKYGFSFANNEELLGVGKTGLAFEEMYKEVKFFKDLEKEFDYTQIPKASKLYKEYNYDFVKKELFPIIGTNSTEDLVSIVQESELLTDYLLECFEQDLTQIGENIDTIVQIATDGPQCIDDEVMDVIKKVTSLLGHRSWSLNNYQIDCKYLEVMGEKLGKNFNSFANSRFGTTLDESEEEAMETSLKVNLDDINLDLGLDFEF